jgi:hypothetical protein
VSKHPKNLERRMSKDRRGAARHAAHDRRRVTVDWTPDREEETLLASRPEHVADPEFQAFRATRVHLRDSYFGRWGLVVGLALNTAAIATTFLIPDLANPAVLMTGHAIVEVVLILSIVFLRTAVSQSFPLGVVIQLILAAVYAANMGLNVVNRANEASMIGSVFTYSGLILIFTAMAPARGGRMAGLALYGIFLGLGAFALRDHPVFVKWVTVETLFMIGMVVIWRIAYVRTEQETLLEFHARKLIARARQIEREKDLTVAREIQESQLPPESVMTAGDGVTSIQCFQRKHETVCGDWMAVRSFAGGATVAVIADATGKGVHAGLVAQAVQTLWVDLDAAAPFDADAWIRKVNAALVRLGAKKPQSMTLGLLVIREREVQYWSAGHVPLFVRERAQAGDVPKTRLLVGRGGMLGMTEKVSLAPLGFAVPPGGDCELMLASDGVFDRGTRYGAEEIDALFGALSVEGARYLAGLDTEDDRSVIHVRIAEASEAAA